MGTKSCECNRAFTLLIFIVICDKQVDKPPKKNNLVQEKSSLEYEVLTRKIQV